MRQNNAVFIVIEGLDGTGKSTQIELLRRTLEARGIPVFTDAEPTAYPTGRLLRQVLAGEIPSNEWASAALFFADRVRHVTDPENGVRRHLADGETVILDRYYFSTFAYQGTDTDLSWVMQMHYGCPEIERPDLVLFLDMEPAACLRRIRENRADRALEIYETQEKLTAIRARFTAVFDLLRDRENVVRIDADGTIDEVAARILAAVEGIL